MFIIVEGPDGAGKSTLVYNLLKAYPGSVHRHFGRPETDEDAYNYWQVYAEAIDTADPGLVTIFDRSWYTDLVYGPVFRNRTEMSLMHVKMLEAMVYVKGGGHVIYCTAPIKTLWARCGKRGEDYVRSRQQLLDVSNGYADILTNVCTLPVVRFDTGAKW